MALTFTLLDFDSATVVVGAPQGARVTLSVVGGRPLSTLELRPNATGAVLIPSRNLQDGLGAVRLEAANNDPIVASVAVRAKIPGPATEEYVDRHALSEALNGAQYRIPYLADGTRPQTLRLAVTNLAAQTVRLQDRTPDAAAVDFGPASIATGQTVLVERELGGSGIVCVEADGPLAVSAIFRRSSPREVRVFPLPVG